MGDSTVHLTEQNFDETLAQSDGVLMVDFWAEWCGPCKAIAPVLEELTREAGGRLTLAKVNVDENPRLQQRFGVTSIPTMIVMKDGSEIDRIVGAAPKPALEARIRPHVGSSS